MHGQTEIEFHSRRLQNFTTQILQKPNSNLHGGSPLDLEIGHKFGTEFYFEISQKSDHKPSHVYIFL